MQLNLLESLGFTKGETRVYLSLLELGESPSGKIAMESKVSRSKIYEVLAKLKEKGMVSESIRSNVRFFSALSPHKIGDYIEQRQAKLQEDKMVFEEVLPKLLQRQKSMGIPEVRVYEGVEGIRTFYREMVTQLEGKDEYLGFSFSGSPLSNMPIVMMFHRFHKTRAKKGTRAKILYHNREEMPKGREDYSYFGNYESRITPVKLPTGTAIFRDTVAMFNWSKPPRIFAIMCRENAEQYRNFFYDIWNRSVKK